MRRYRLLRKVVSAFAVLSVLVSVFAGTGASFGAPFSGDDKVVIVLDPGHGAYSPDNYSEGSYNLRTALRIKEALDANGNFSVYLTHTEDGGDISHYERARIADSVNADVMISVHFNANENGQARGMEAWTSVIDKFNMDSLAGLCIDYALKAVPEIPYGGIFRRKDTSNFYWDEKYQWDIKDDSSSGVLSDYYGIITWGLKFGVPTFILEEAYLSNEEDFAIVNNDETINKIAAAQAQAIIDYYTAHEHTYETEFTSDVPASCISRGKQSRHCSVCGHRKEVGTITDEIDKNAHFMRIIEEVAPTDGNEGYTVWSCVYTDSLINKAKIQYEAHGGTTIQPAHEHKYTIIEAYQAYPGHDGSAKYRCDLCGDSRTETFPYGKTYCNEHGHVNFLDYTIPEVQPTCTEKGKKHYFCLACGEGSIVYTEPLGHKFETVSITSAKCEENGSKTEKCTVCAEMQTSVLAALGHDYETVVTRAPACTEDGAGKNVCRVCAKEDGETVIPATGHTFDGGRVTKNGGLFTDGEKVYTCPACGTSYSEVIAHSAPIGEKVLVLIIVLAAIILSASVVIIRKIKAGGKKAVSAGKDVSGPLKKRRPVSRVAFKGKVKKKEPGQAAAAPEGNSGTAAAAESAAGSLAADSTAAKSIQEIANAVSGPKKQTDNRNDDDFSRNILNRLKDSISDNGTKIDKNL